MSESKNNLILDYMGDDDFAMPVYQDQFGHLWKEVNLGEQEQPCLYSVSGNSIDGEPNMPITQEFTIQTKKEFVSRKEHFQYQMLYRLKSDCEYYLGYGYRNPNCLWAKTEDGQIEEMKKIWNSFSDDEKPEWLTWKQIEKYERDIVFQKKIKPGIRFMVNESKVELELIEIKTTTSGTENEEPSPVTLLRDVTTGREFFCSLEALKYCGITDITITKEPTFSKKETAISNNLICALFCRQTVSLYLSDGSAIQGIVESISMDQAMIKKNELPGRIATVLFKQINNMFIM